MSKLTVAGVLLSAGQSRRFHGNKLMSCHPETGQTLLSHTAARFIQALSYQATTPSVVVVTGKWQKAIQPSLNALPVQSVFNPNWHKGMGTSLSLGVSSVMSQSQPFSSRPSHIMVGLADLPCLTDGDYRALLHASEREPEHIICCEWQGNYTVPAIFPQKAFEELIQLSGDKGAKHLISHWQENGKVTAVSIPNAQWDIDTPEDWDQLATRAEGR
ncbi:nucleotidyltransferase family protein [Alteromonas australica]|uniref:MobA-like NTP transferase domain-containing protein n=1 Tax=Alteromonas australica TaxID=589873 RepID=A0A075P297_9ALTE|nr:nucleotidyltransferase family protein [Alteromonas australica]AIF99125.1 hypothetical protein EP13_10765 [Alteromonas australica]|tara:strand:- start:196 stop:843 length:648 start_codon:yes stop_codon:yes gene_type:complete